LRYSFECIIRKTSCKIPPSKLKLATHFLNVDKAGRGILRTFRKYLYAFGLTLRKEIAAHISSAVQWVFFAPGFMNIFIWPGVKDWRNISSIFSQCAFSPSSSEVSILAPRLEFLFWVAYFHFVTSVLCRQLSRMELKSLVHAYIFIIDCLKILCKYV